MQGIVLTLVMAVTVERSISLYSSANRRAEVE